ncbi:MAG: molybdopterin-synthase adenylyltransferase MoeB [Armatimonadota bacterium]|nr:molybdopterin-synthase adenylyltransferase MoeB [Armatimonadota bacterium]MDR7474624.1 molybdopterin-synthase adenylyltransferase MoeB [Armatimonadota bacterium]
MSVTTHLLSNEQLQRYSRQVILAEVGVGGQRRLLDSKVLIIGAGGLGSPAALYLAAAGVGTLGIVDGDRVDLTNLHRQILHHSRDLGRPKTQTARRTIEEINPDVTVIPFQTTLTRANALDILKDFDVILNGSDNFPTRYLVNDACVLLGRPLVDASVLRWEAQFTVYLPGRGCYRCLFPTPPPPGAVPSCAEAGVIGAVAGFMGTLQAIEAVKILLGKDEVLVNRLLLFDALEGRMSTLRWSRNPHCPVCGDRPTIHQLIDYEQFCGVPGRHAAEAVAPAVVEVSVEEAARLVQEEGAFLLDVREPWEWGLVRIPGAVLIPRGQVAARVSEIPRDPPVVVYCAVGQRSAEITLWLRERGYQRAVNLAGGITAWAKAQLPVES